MEEDLLKKRIMELRKRADFSCYPVFTDFLTLSEVQCAKNVLNGCKFQFFGGIADCERVMLGIASEEAALSEQDFPITCLRISPKNRRFAEKLSHRDILGSVLGLGLERSVIGDIFLKDTDAYLFCCERMESFLSEQLTQVRHTQVSCERFSLSEIAIEREFKEFTRSVAAVRMDAIAAAAFHVSRSTAAADIPSGKLFLNGKEILSPSTIVKEGDVISYRGLGKVKLKTIGALTKKGRISVTFLQYQ